MKQSIRRAATDAKHSYIDAALIAFDERKTEYVGEAFVRLLSRLFSFESVSSISCFSIRVIVGLLQGEWPTLNTTLPMPVDEILSNFSPLTTVGELAAAYETFRTIRDQLESARDFAAIHFALFSIDSDLRALEIEAWDDVRRFTADERASLNNPLPVEGIMQVQYSSQLVHKSFTTECTPHSFVPILHLPLWSVHSRRSHVSRCTIASSARHSVSYRREAQARHKDHKRSACCTTTTRTRAAQL